MKATTKEPARTKPARVRLTLTRPDVLFVQDAIDHRGPFPNKQAEARRAALQRQLHALTGEEMPPTREAVAAELKAAQQLLAPPAAPVHTPLMIDDRDELDRLRARIEQSAVLVQHVLSAPEDEEDGLDDAGRVVLKLGLIECCASIVADAAALRAVLDGAEKRRADGAR
jgi:hypothetical protein